MARSPGLIMSSLHSALSLGTLAADTTVLFVGLMDTELDAPFLVKQIQMNGGVHDLDPTDGVIFGFAQGDATIAEISSALAQSATDSFDVGEIAPVFKKSLIFWETLRYLSSENNTINEMIKIGGGKGIPLAETKGINAFVFNAGVGSLTTGASANLLSTIKGVWLGD